MRLSGRVLADEEIGKKDDDHQKRTARSKVTAGPSWRLPRRRRILLVLAGIYFIYLFIKNMPTDLPPASERFGPRPIQRPSQVAGASPRGPPPMLDGDLPARSHYFNGPIKFHEFAQTLYFAQGLGGYSHTNKIVVFAAADLKSLSDLLPLACEMASQKINRVHFAVMGRDDIPINDIQEVNRFNETDCPLLWHDARPDYGPWSTDIRMEVSVRSALGHFVNYVRPHVVVTHDESQEDSFFWKGVVARANQIGLVHIGLPHSASNFMWMSKLDGGSLQAWNKIQLEVLLLAPSKSSGSLIRLLNSLQKADYFGPAPSLTIELPPDADAVLVEYLANFKWPPNSASSRFTLRRRIQPHKITPEESSVRIIDSIYPKDTAFSHVLVLSPQVDLSPSYYQFLKYTLLRYKYSSVDREDADRLLGISLELPSTRPTDGESFTPPKIPSHLHTQKREAKDDIPLFLWQIPNSNAALYFGDKWVEFHSFLFNRFAVPDKPKSTSNSTSMSKKFPAWMEYMLEFIQARGYHLLFPAFSSQDGLALATVHNELYHQPEEHAWIRKPSDDDRTRAQVIDPSKPLTGVSEQESLESHSIEKSLSTSSSISNLLHVFSAHLPDLSSMDVLPHTGDQAVSTGLIERTEQYLKTFRRDIGGCDGGGTPPERIALKADDLFCLSKEDS